MKRDSVLGALLLSEKRRDLMTYLLDGSRTLDEVKRDLDVTTSGIRPQIKVLKERGYVEEFGDREFRLTELGRLLAENVEPLLATVDAVRRHEEYWETHDLSAIPEHLLARLRELEGTRIVEHPEEGLYDPHDEFFENIAESEWVRGMSPVFHPKYPEFFHKAAAGGMDVSLILSDTVFEKAKAEYAEKVSDFLDHGNAEMYVYDGDLRIASGFTERFFSITLYFEDGPYDTRRDLVSLEEPAVDWGVELYDWYRERSTEITGL